MISPRPNVLLLAMLAGACIPRAASAQTSKTWEVSGGYAVARDSTSDLNFPIGWTAGAGVNLTHRISAVAEVSGSHQTISTAVGDLNFGVHTLMAGGRASIKIGRAVEFGQLLAGVVRATGSAFGSSSASSHFGAQVGGGVDYPLARKIAVRAQLDFRVVGGGGLGLDRGRQYRFATSIVYGVF